MLSNNKNKIIKIYFIIVYHKIKYRNLQNKLKQNKHTKTNYFNKTKLQNDYFYQHFIHH